jgi:tetratricopeptide (TPR) repeat protein
MSADQKLDFKYTLPERPSESLIELPLAELEVVLKNNVSMAQPDARTALWQLGKFYSSTRRHEPALDCLRQIMTLETDLERKAGCVLAMGQTMEQVGDYAAAVRYYREAFAYEPSQTHTWYFIHNNLGYSLNQVGDFVQGERYCRAATTIDPNRPNAFKNLGLALQGQQRWKEAARCFVQATQVEAADPRSLRHLEDLLQAHPELDFRSELELCRGAVAHVREKRAAAPAPVIKRGWRSRWFLWQNKLRAWFHHLRKGETRR